MNKQDAFIHTSDGSVLKTRMTFAKLQNTLSANYIRITRGCLVSAMTIHSVGKFITLSNGKTLEIVDYSPEIDKYLHIVCFPIFKGRCGCLLFDISETRFSAEKSVGEKAILLYLKKLME